MIKLTHSGWETGENMKRLFLGISLLLLIMIFTSCDGGTGNPFAGSQWDIGVHHVSFSHAVADWNTTDNRLDIKFDLLAGSTYPDAVVLVDSLTTLAVDTPRECTIVILIADGLTFESSPSDPDAQAEINFTRFDIGPLGAVSGTITGMARHMESPLDPPVAITASFENVVIVN